MSVRAPRTGSQVYEEGGAEGGGTHDERLKRGDSAGDPSVLKPIVGEPNIEPIIRESTKLLESILGGSTDCDLFRNRTFRGADHFSCFSLARQCAWAAARCGKQACRK